MADEKPKRTRKKAETVDEATKPPVRDSEPVEGASGEPGGSPADEDVVIDETAVPEAAGEAEVEETPAAEPEEAAVAESTEVEEAAAEEVVAEAEAPVEEPAAEPPVRDSGPEEGTPGEPGGSPADEEVAAEAEEPVAEEPAAEEVVAEVEAPAEAEEATPPAPEPARKKKRLPRGLRRQRPRPRREQPKTRKPIVRLPKPEAERGRRQERRGVVVSSSSDKTIVVKVDTIKAHRRYKKVVRRSERFHAHDEQNRAHVGDLVRIVETRPLSKLKRWRLAEVIEEAK